jgi:hypothetical protein
MFCRFLLLVGLLACSWCWLADWCRGVLQPDLVVSGSMAPAFLGPHYSQSCRECQALARCDAAADSSQSWVCSHCGLRQNWDEGISVSAGDPTWIARQAAPRRWSVFAFEDESGSLQMKRIVGLPGEKVTLAEGDAFVDGQRLQKSPAEIRRVRQLVFDAQYQQKSSIPRWRVVREQGVNEQGVNEQGPPSADGGWKLGEIWTYSRTSLTADPANESTLAYHHYLGYESPWGRRKPAFIQDDYPYNSGLSRNLHAVDDVMVEADVTLAAGTWLKWRFASRAGEVTFCCEKRGSQGTRILLRHRGVERSWRVFPHQRAQRMMVGLCDRRAIWQWGEQWGALDLEWSGVSAADSDADLSPAVIPLQLVAGGNSASLANVRLWRDIYYYWPSQLPQPERLSAAHWLLLGDNVPVSQDGRYAPSGVSGRCLVGEVKSR